MSPFLLTTLVLIALLIAVGLYRVWAGPTVFDRLVAVALVSVNGVVALVVLGFVFERPSLFIDIALGFALLAFLLPIALGRYFEERDDGSSVGGATPDRSEPRPAGVAPRGWMAERGRAASRRPKLPEVADEARDDDRHTGRDDDPAEDPGSGGQR